jgi:hypothetical protein
MPSNAKPSARVIVHKKPRMACLGTQIALIFEDELTISDQTQETVRIETAFEE